MKIEEETIKSRYATIAMLLNERQKRLWAANEARHLGYGGISKVARSTGLSRSVIKTGIQELQEKKDKVIQFNRSRRKGGGRKRLEEKDKTLRSDLEKLVEPATFGNPQSPLRWTSKSTRKIASELQRMGHQISYPKVAALLQKMDYSLQGNKKAIEGGNHPDRDVQFEYISQRIKEYKELGQPVISVDAKKKS